MLDLTISCLALNFDCAPGHGHRIQPISQRAASMLAADLAALESGGSRSPGSMHLGQISAPALNLDLNRSSNEQAARQIATAWLEAIALHLKV
jgi:hypothetical protein